MLKRKKHLFIIIILFICYNSFFVNKALHIDDPFTVSIAREVNINFLKPACVFFSNPTLLGYYYAPVIKILGEREPWLHIFYFPFSIMVILSMFFLALRFSNRSLVPLLFLISTPAFIISSQSIMLDIPLLGLFLLAIATFVYGVDNDNSVLLSLSAIFTSFAILTKYSGLLIIPILFIYALLNSGKKNLKYLLIPLGIFLLWNVYCVICFGKAIFFPAFLYRLRDYFLNRMAVRLIASLSFLSGTSIIILALAPFLLKKKTLVYFMPSIATGLLPFMIKSLFYGYSFFEKCTLSVLFVCSSYVVFLIFNLGLKALFKRDKDTLFLSIWFFSALFFNLLTNFIAARFFLLVFPPLFLLIYNELHSANPKMIKSKLKYIIFISLIFSTVLAAGDYQFAGIYRDFVHSLRNKFPEEAAKKTMYFDKISYYSGWGYAYYLDNAGGPIKPLPKEQKDLDKGTAIYFVPSEPVLPFVIEDRSGLAHLLRAEFDKVLLDSVNYAGNIFIHNRKFHSGFYCHDWGLLPFNFSMHRVPIEVFKFYKISRLPED